MARLTVLCLLALLAFADRGNAQQKIIGTWRQNTPNVGESDWKIGTRDDGTHFAREVGLGNATGTATLKGNTLTIHWKSGDYSGFYEWELTGTTGKGRMCYTKYPAGETGGVEQEIDGKKVRAFDNSKVRFVGR